MGSEHFSSKYKIHITHLKKLLSENLIFIKDKESVYDVYDKGNLTPTKNRMKSK